MDDEHIAAALAVTGMEVPASQMLGADCYGVSQKVQWYMVSLEPSSPRADPNAARPPILPHFAAPATTGMSRSTALMVSGPDMRRRLNAHLCLRSLKRWWPPCTDMNFTAPWTL
jgi:hypothetical protein